jgi:hypothetical protein
MQSREADHSDHGKIAEDHRKIAQMWTCETQGAYSKAMECTERARSIVEQSRRQLHKSDALLKWREAYGPLPELTESM